MEQIIKLVKEMRDSQKSYFRLHAKKAYTEAKEELVRCKLLEKEVDNRIKVIFNEI
jgi:hypothetical protein